MFIYKYFYTKNIYIYLYAYMELFFNIRQNVFYIKKKPNNYKISGEKIIWNMKSSEMGVDACMSVTIRYL